MRVKLVQMTKNPIDIMWMAARTCYSEKSPIEMWEDLEEIYQTTKHWNLVKKVLDSKHESIAEHVYFTFAIEGVSRALLAQLTRHRLCSFSVMSQRYVEIKENINEIQNFRAFPVSKREEAMKTCSKYFINVNEDNCNGYVEALWEYLNAINNGVKPEDARMFLPNATKTNITMSCNYRELIHISSLRLCSRSQREIRDLFALIKKEIEKAEPRLAEYLVPTCERQNFCTEHNSCGRKPKLEEINKG